jgi:hypothetical protein
LGAVTAFYIVMVIAWSEERRLEIIIIQLIAVIGVTYSSLSNIWDLWHQKQDHFRMFSTQRLHCHTSSTYHMNYDVDRIRNRLGI